jgi:hypothetical protein
MGGFGSGRHGGKRRTNDMHALDVRSIGRAGRLTDRAWFTWQWTCNGETAASIQIRVEADRVVLNHRNRSSRHNDGEWESMTYPVRLDWTPCALGGRRAWWRCPVVGCGRRVALLYGGPVFACRQCRDLAYRCQRETNDDRATRRAETLRRRLGWDPGILNDKGMHWRTYERLLVHHDDWVRAAPAGMAMKLGLMQGRLEAIESAASS